MRRQAWQPGPMLVGGVIVLATSLYHGRHLGRAPSRPLAAAGDVSGRVLNADGVTVEVCGVPAAVDAAGRFSVEGVTPPCDVVARRHFGVFQWEDRAPAFDGVVIEAPAVTQVLPLVVAPDDGGMRVVEDWSGSELVGVRLLDLPEIHDVAAWHLAMAARGDGVHAEGRGRVSVPLAALGFDDWLASRPR